MNGDVKTKIIKRNGEEVTFDLDKIINAITKANDCLLYTSDAADEL